MNDKPPSPPKVTEWLLRHITDGSIRYSAMGDFEEQFRFIAASDGSRRARWWYRWQTLRSFPSFVGDTFYWSLIMFKNYLKIALRNVFKHKAYSLINIVGLTAGMTCSMLILMWVQDELSFDRFNEKANDIYRVVENQFYAGGEVFPVAVTPSALAPALKEQFPEIIKSTRLSYRGWTIRYGDNIFSERGALVDPDMFEIFTLEFIEGDPKAPFSNPHAIILTEELAEKYFGDERAVGKVVNLNNRHDFVVTGVVKNIPENSHLRYDFLIPFVYLEELGTQLDNWSRNWCNTYVLLEENTTQGEVDEKIIDFLKKNREESSTELHLQPLTKIHLYTQGKYTADNAIQGDIQYVQIFSAIAFFVLLIACINFMNLATARSERRAKEVGLRKVVGAYRYQLVKQFLGESIGLSLIAFLLALLVTELLLPVFNELSGKNLAIGQLPPQILLGFLGIALVAGVISGSYPALYLSSFRPIETLKGSKSTHGGGSLFRKILVVVQFTLSIIMIIGTLVVSRQLDYIRAKNLGLDKENLAYIWLTGKFEEKYETAKQELLKNPNITSVTATSQLPTYVASSSSGWEWEGKNPEDNILMHYVCADYDYVKTFKMEMTAGRFFSPEFSTDTLAAVVNETAVDIMGMESPVGKRLSIGSDNLSIIGVVKDFHFKPIETKIEPLVVLLIPDRYNVMVMRIRPEDISETVSYVEGVYKKFNADRPFALHFLDESYDELYRAEQRTGKISRYFAILAILISCLGLYGLASHMGEQRTKEIGIRKVLGASVSTIFFLLAKNFVLLAVLANLIAWPVAYFVTRNWLQNYAYHASLSIMIFIIAASAAIVIVFVTVSYQAVKAALTNPVSALRYE